MTSVVQKIVVVALFAALPVVPTPGFAQSAPATVAATCTPTGPYRFAGLNTSSETVLPSIAKQISVLGQIAYKSGCAPHVFCVAVDATDAAREVARNLCRNIARALVMSKRGEIRRTARQQVVTTVRRPGRQFQAGAAYLTLQ